MRYVLIDSLKNGDFFTTEFESSSTAISTAKNDWERLSKYDKGRRSEFVVIRSNNPDENSTEHLDGAIMLCLK